MRFLAMLLAAGVLFHGLSVTESRGQGGSPSKIQESMRELEQLIGQVRDAVRRGDWAGASAAQRLIIKARRKLLGDYHVDTAAAVRELKLQVSDFVRGDDGDTDKRLRAVGDMLWGDVSPTKLEDVKVKLQAESDVLHQQAYQLRGKGNFLTGNRLERAAFTLRRDILGPHLDTVKSGHLLAWGLYREGSVREAELFNRQTLAMAQQVLGAKHSLSRQVLQNLAYDLREQGKYTDAEAVDRQSLALVIAVNGEEHPETAFLCNNLGFDMSLQGRHVEAVALYRKALAINFKTLGESHHETLVSMSNVAATLQKCGEASEAIKINRRIHDSQMKILDENAKSTNRKPFNFQFFCRNLNNLAVLLMREDKLDDAEETLKLALPILEIESIIGREDVTVTSQKAAIHQNLASVQSSLGRGKEAMASAQAAFDIHRKAFGDQHPMTLHSQSMLASLTVIRGDLVEGEQMLAKAAEQMERLLGPDHSETVQTTMDLVHAQWVQGKYDAAITTAQIAVRGFEKARLLFGSSGLERSAFASNYSTPMHFLAVLQARAGKHDEAWKHFEDDLARGLLDDLSSRESRRLTADQRLQEQVLQGEIARIDKKLSAFLELKNGPQWALAKLHDDRNLLMLKLGQFQAELEKAYGPAAGQVFDRERIQAKLPTDSAIVGWLDIESGPRAKDPSGEHWAVVVRGQGSPIWVKLQPADNDVWGERDRSLLREARKVLLDPSTEPDDDLKALSRQRLQPLEKHLQGIKHIIVLPSEMMAGIPIEALTDKFRVSYAPSGTVYAMLQEKRHGPEGTATGILALGDPIFSSEQNTPPATERGFGVKGLVRGKTPRPLPGTRGEVEAISQLFSDQKTEVVKLLGVDASERRLDQMADKKELARFRFVHLATHGFTDALGGMNSYLALTPEDLKGEVSSKLSAGHIRRTWHLQADLVTLSACQTALGEHRGGEGYIGFAQSLLFAGARSLVLSQWPVNDGSTTLLMHRFYENLLGSRKELPNSLSRVEALVEAQNWLRKLNLDEATRRLQSLKVPVDPAWADRQDRTARPYQHPFYWAPFILVGDPGTAMAKSPEPRP